MRFTEWPRGWPYVFGPGAYVTLVGAMLLVSGYSFIVFHIGKSCMSVRKNRTSQSTSLGVTPTSGVMIPPGQIVPVLWTFSPAAPKVNDDVTFNASGVAPAPGHAITSYSWDFSDGTIKTGVVVHHDFGLAGTYNVVLTTTDDTGQSKTFGKTVTVS